MQDKILRILWSIIMISQIMHIIERPNVYCSLMYSIHIRVRKSAQGVPHFLSLFFRVSCHTFVMSAVKWDQYSLGKCAWPHGWPDSWHRIKMNYSNCWFSLWSQMCESEARGIIESFDWSDLSWQSAPFFLVSWQVLSGISIVKTEEMFSDVLLCFLCPIEV